MSDATEIGIAPPDPLPAEDVLTEESEPQQGNGVVLRLHRMEVAGFKSFSDRTEIVFPEGITAVVGPNGCGKSNIGDAINWVLGAQSPKLLRGTSMQDVIFNGTEARKPTGMAEVSLHLVAPQGTLPDGRREVVVTRRLFRDGESDYLLNGARARLKDIQEVLRKARVGAKTYATIEQGQIDQILNAKPQERRLIIEDAAGVAGFKHKRRLAELKLEATQANLLRVNDVVSEVRRQINALKRQAAKARRYQRLREELRRRKRERFARQARALDDGLRAAREEEARARSLEAEAAARLGRVESEIAAERQALEEAEEQFRGTARQFHHLEAEVDRREERLQACRERIAEARETSARLEQETHALLARRAEISREMEAAEAEAASESREVEGLAARLAEAQASQGLAVSRLEDLRRRVEDLRRGLFDSMNRAAERRNRRRTLEEAIDRSRIQQQRLAEERAEVGAELERLEGQEELLGREAGSAAREAERLRTESEAAEAELRAARERQGAALEKLAAAREREKSTAARLRTLEDVATRFAGVSDGVRILLTSGDRAGVRTSGVVADYVEAGRQFEAAAEVYLQAFLPAVVLEDDADAARAAAILRAEHAGRTSLLSRTQPTGAPAVGGAGRPPFPEEMRRDPRVLGRLSDHLKLKTGANGFVQDRIGDAIVVDSLESALSLHRLHPHEDYLTAAGEVVYASGVVATGGANGADHGLLAHQRKTREARAQLAEAASEAAARLAEVEAERAGIAALEARAEECRKTIEKTREGSVEVEMRARAARDDRARAARRIEILAQEIAAHEEEAVQLASDLAAAGGEVEEAEGIHRRTESALGQAHAVLEAAEREMGGIAEAVAALREELAGRRQRRENVLGRRRQLDEILADLTARVEQARQEAESCERRAGEAAELQVRTEQDLAGHLERRQHQAAEVSRLEQLLGERRAALAARDEALRTERASTEDGRQAATAAELARARAESDRAHLDDLCAQELGITATEALASAGPTSEEVDVELLETAISELHGRIEEIGPVNMTAIEEFSALEERHAFLSSQRHDLEQAMESLRETIRRINRSSRARFAEAFEAIRKNYQEIYTVLFGGGRADLRLEEGEDVLECGIEIMAQPPGKRLGSVSLLSGGEKAMSAIALLFAIFRYQPSPFCLLDEVDAALDDVNVGRFARMLKEYARENQFIIITHNKLSMEAADLLYGVTMEEPGVSKVVSLQLT